jgi:hypothetical protein
MRTSRFLNLDTAGDAQWFTGQQAASGKQQSIGQRANVS